MDLRSSFSARRGVTPTNQRPASLPIRAPITLEGYSSSDASSYLEEESFDSEEETRAFVDVSTGEDSAFETGDSLDSNVEMPRAKLTPEDEDFDDESFEDGSFEVEEEWESGVEEEFSVGMEERDGVLNEERGKREHGFLVSVENEAGERAQGNGNGGREVEGVGFDGYFGEAGGEVGRGSSEVDEEFSVVMEGIGGFSGEKRVEGGHGFLASAENEGERWMQGNGGGSGEGEGFGCGGYSGEEDGESVRGSSEVVGEAFCVGMEEKDRLWDEERIEGGHGFLASSGKNEGEQWVRGNGNVGREVDVVGFGGYLGEAEGEVVKSSSEVEGGLGLEERDGVLDGESFEGGHGFFVSAENQGEQPTQGNDNGNGGGEGEGVVCCGYFRETTGEVVRGSSEVEEGFSEAMGEKGGFLEEGRVEGGHGFFVSEENEGEQWSQGNGDDDGEGEDVGCGWYFGGADGEAARPSSVDGKEEVEVVEDAVAVFTEYTLESKSRDSAASDAAEFGDTAGVKLGDEISDLAAISAILNKSNGAPSVVDGFSDNKDGTGERKGRFLERIEQMRAKFLRLVHSLDRSPLGGIAVEVLSLLDLAEGSKQIGDFRMDMARWKALRSEENGKGDLDFRCNILLLGKSGVGKSALINAIFGEDMCATDAFAPSTKSIQEMVGVVNGVEICFVDTPGLTNSVALNMKILSSIRKHIKRHPPDVILYVSRLDVVTSDMDDLPSLRLISSLLGSSIWSRCIPVLTHGSYSLDDGSNGMCCSYDVFVEKRCRVVQNSLQLVSGNMHATNPVALVESHPSCTRDEAGETVLPDGLPWRSHLLLMCYSLGILSEVISVLKSEDPPARSFLGFRTLLPSLLHFLSNLLQSKNAKITTTDQSWDSGYSKLDLDELDSKEDEYDPLPSFRSLKQSKFSTPNKEHGGAHFKEYCHQIRLLQKKELDWGSCRK